MDVTSIGPAGLDPFTATPVASEEARETPDNEARETAPLPEGSGTVVDTSA